jgi:phage terminase large subunit-like protein
MGIDLLDWQRNLLNDVLLKDTDPDAGISTWARSAYWSCSRQNGKTLVAQIISGWFLTEMSKLRGKPVTNIFAAHNTRLAANVFRDSADLLADHYDISIRSGNGREEISMSTPKGRSKWILVANRQNAPRGFTADCVWLDEMQAFSEETISGGFQPTMTARNPRTAGGFPIMLLTGTAGDETSTYQINYRQQAFESIDAGELNRSYMAEWSSPESADYRKAATWAYANPGMGETIHVSALEHAYKTQSRDQFIQERCNNMQTSGKTWISAIEWDNLETKNKCETPSILAIESSVDESRYVGVLAGIVGDKVHLSEAFVVKDEKSMWEHVEEIMQNRQISLMLTPTLEIHLPMALRRRYQITGYAELLKYTGLVQKMIKEKRVTHNGAQTMRDHVLRAALVRTVQGVVLTSQKSSGPIEMARCAVWAVSAVSRPQNRQKPMLVVM